MGMKISVEQSVEAAELRSKAVNERFSGTGIIAETVLHADGVIGNRGRKGYAFIRVNTPPQHWVALAKWLKFDQKVNHCSMITGTHFPDGTPERGWEVVAHLMALPIKNVRPNSCTKYNPESMDIAEIPSEYEVIISLPQGEKPSVPSVQSVWAGADWNEKETWDLVGIQFSGHENMFRVLNPHDSPPDFHPLQKQHKIRYHDFNEMYDDPQGFARKPVDEGRVK